MDMHALNELITEEKAEQVAGKILEATKDKITDLITESYYREMKYYLHEHYDNFKSEIEAKLIKEIAESYIKNPKDYKYKDLRVKLFQENQDLIVSTITDEVISQNVDNLIYGYMQGEYYMKYQWFEKICSFIIANWDKFKDIPQMQSAYSNKIRQLEQQNSYLRAKIEQIENI